MLSNPKDAVCLQHSAQCPDTTRKYEKVGICWVFSSESVNFSHEFEIVHVVLALTTETDIPELHVTHGVLFFFFFLTHGVLTVHRKPGWSGQGQGEMHTWIGWVNLCLRFSYPGQNKTKGEIRTVPNFLSYLRQRWAIRLVPLRWGLDNLQFPG